MRHREVHRKLGRSMPSSTWHDATTRRKQFSPCCLLCFPHSSMCTQCLSLAWAAAAQSFRPAGPAERCFLKAAGATLGTPQKAFLISVGVAADACRRAGASASILAAMAKMAELPPYSAPSLPHAQRLLPGPPGAPHLPPVTHMQPQTVPMLK